MFYELPNGDYLETSDVKAIHPITIKYAMCIIVVTSNIHHFVPFSNETEAREWAHQFGEMIRAERQKIEDEKLRVVKQQIFD